MNREKKFKGKSLKYGNWLFGSLWIDGGKCYIIHEKESEKAGENSWYDTYVTEVDPSTVGQYAGLKDKKGKEIYEGDIVRHRGYNGMKISVVVFSNGCFNVGRHQGSSTKETPMLITTNCEVIGNIHDNPELIKQ